MSRFSMIYINFAIFMLKLIKKQTWLRFFIINLHCRKK